MICIKQEWTTCLLCASLSAFATIHGANRAFVAPRPRSSLLLLVAVAGTGVACKMVATGTIVDGTFYIGTFDVAFIVEIV
jgi:hypothetical protein